MGDINAGLMLRFKGANFIRPLVNIYYKFLPLNLPESWGNGGKGGVNVGTSTDGAVHVKVYSGHRTLKAGETLTFATELYLTPFRPLDTEKQWSVRFYHPHAVRDAEFLVNALEQMDPSTGANVLNIHQAHHAAPYINYPYAYDNVRELASLVKKGHEKGVKVRIYLHHARDHSKHAGIACSTQHGGRKNLSRPRRGCPHRNPPRRPTRVADRKPWQGLFARLGRPYQAS